jgi:hypothetical protein
MRPAGGYDPTEGMNPRQRKLWELQQKLAASRKANHNAVVAEKRRKVLAQGAWGASAGPLRSDFVFASPINLAATGMQLTESRDRLREKCGTQTLIASS